VPLARMAAAKPLLGMSVATRSCGFMQCPCGLRRPHSEVRRRPWHNVEVVRCLDVTRQVQIEAAWTGHIDPGRSSGTG
jgi:hypothetical protein